MSERYCAHSWAKKLLQSIFYIVDTETSGLNSSAEVVQVAIVDSCGRTVYQSLIKPIIPFDDNSQAAKTNGLTRKALETAPTFPQVYPKLRNTLIAETVIAYNAKFDKKMLEQDCEKHNLPPIAAEWQCAMERYSQFAGGLKSQRLSKACSAMGVVVMETHEAVADCLLTLELIRAMAKGEE